MQAGAVYNSLLNIVQSVKPEGAAVRRAWKDQAASRREVRALIDRRDGIFHGRLNRWLLKSDGAAADTEDARYPHMPMLAVHGDWNPIYYQWNDKYRSEFPQVLEWQVEVLNELHHQEHNLPAIVDKLRSGKDPNDIPRRRLVLPEWPRRGTWTPS